jgi:uncharacterized DUF497 family protein
MAAIRFEWDERKSAMNVRKHGVSFDEAESVFADENALLLADPDHSLEEDRFILMGLSLSLRVLLVFHCYRKGADVIRIFSARKASRAEREQYARRWFR